MALTVTEPEGQESYPFYRFMTTDGVGGGTSNFIGDYSSVPAVAIVNARPPGELLICEHIGVHIEDTGNFDPVKYGALAALTNGVIIGVFDATGTEVLRVTQEPIKDHAEWAHYGDWHNAEAAAGDMMFVTKVDLVGSLLNPGLRLYAGWSIRATLSDNMTGLVEHRFILHGSRQKHHR